MHMPYLLLHELKQENQLMNIEYTFDRRNIRADTP